MTHPTFTLTKFSTTAWLLFLRQKWLHYALPMAAVWTIWLLAFWPGIMSVDSIDQWSQMVNWRFDDRHPPAHTLTNWLITQIWFSPAAIALAQIVVLSIVAGWGLSLMRRMGVSRLITWGCALLFALSPVNSTMVITLWKDIFYSIGVLALSLLVVEIISSNGDWLKKRGAWIILGGVAALITLYRHNGFAAGVGTLIILIFFYPRQRRSLVAATTLAISLWMAVIGPFYNSLDVSRVKWFSLQPLIFQVAAHVAAHTPLLPDEASYLNTIRPMEDNWQYSCYGIVPVIFLIPTFNGSIIDADTNKFIRIWWQLTIRNPEINIKHLVCSSQLIWRIFSPPDGFLYAMNIRGEGGSINYISPNQLELYPNSRLPHLSILFTTWLSRSQQPDWQWLIWRPALYLYLALTGSIIAAIRLGQWKYLLVMLPLSLHSFPLIFATLSQDVRYQYSAFLVALIIGIPFLLGLPITNRK